MDLNRTLVWIELIGQVHGRCEHGLGSRPFVEGQGNRGSRLIMRHSMS